MYIHERNYLQNKESDLQDQGSYLQNQKSDLYFVVLILIFLGNLYFFVS